MKRGMIYGVGVGPGDPELLTLQAVRILRKADVIAVPGEEAASSLSYRIACAAVPELSGKETAAIPMPMTREPGALEQAHRAGAARLAAYADEGRSVAFLTLGDVTVYSTFGYLHRLLTADGYEVTLVCGVPSFCAAAARLGVMLAEGDEPIHVCPGGDGAQDALALPGTCVLMKTGRRMAQLLPQLRRSGRAVGAVENCTLPDERIYRSAQELPEEAGYFTLVVAKEAK